MTSRIIISFFLLNLFLAFSGQAQVTRNFEDRVSYNVNGNITMVGNTLLTCDISNWWCDNYQDGSYTGSNGTDMVFVNIDSAAGYSNSSSASLTIPIGATVLHAELYWSGRHNNNEANRDKIRIKAPGSGSYTQVTAHTIDTYASEGSSGSRPYQASADVTQIVTNGGSGSYTVADLTAKTGNDSLGFYGGWALAVVYQDNTEPFRRLMLFDGAATVVGSNTVSITTDNLVTPYSGSFNTYLAALVWEGDQSLDGDSLVFEGNTLDESLNPDDNFWNSSITSFNSRVTNKNPDYVNQLGMDLVMTDVSGLLPNGETQADIDFVTDGDYYFPHALAFITDLYLPDFNSSMDKTATDINGGQVEPGDVIEYRVSFENTGQDVAINTVVTDALPSGISYLPNSLEIVNSSAGPAGAMSDTVGDDAAEYDANSNTITFWVGNNATYNQGGNFLPTESAVIKFLATVDNQNSGAVTNDAFISFNAQTTPAEPLSATDDAVINVVATAGINVTKTAQLTTDNGNPGTADAGDEITFSIDVENTGNLAMNNINLTDAMAPLGAVTCPSNNLAAFSTMSCDSYTYTVTQTDISNGGSIDNTVQLTADDAAAGNHQDSDSTQTVLTLAEPVITAPSENDLLNDNTPTVSGTGPVGAQIDVVTDQGSSCQTIVDGSGNWSCDISPALTDGSIIISAFASDGGSNQSATDSVTVDLDATAPAAPGVNAPTNGQPITGTGEPGATVTVVTDNGDSCTAEVDDDGNWSCDLGPDVVDGDTITVTQEDEAGNVSPETNVANGIDTTPPGSGSITGISDDSGISNSDFITNDNTLLISGTAEADATVEVYVDGISVGTTTADGSGNWTFDYSSTTLADGDYDITTVITDVAGNASGTSAPQTVSIDTSAPNAPEINVPTNNVSITGTGEPGATVTVTTGSSGGCTAIVQGDGSWSCDLSGPLTDGDDITASQQDPAGNTSPDTTENGGIDISPPGSGIITGISDDSGVSNSDFITNDNTLLISGTAEADATVEVYVDGVSVGTTTADSSGNWTFDYTGTALSDGNYAITTIVTDVAGNASGTSAPQTVSVDTTTPGSGVITGISDDSGVSNSDFITNDNTLLISGTAEADATVEVYVDGVSVGTTTADSSGNWTFDYTGTALSDGNYAITTIVTDVAGNDSGTSAPQTVSVDTTTPGSGVITGISDDSGVSNSDFITNDNTLLISGTAEADATVEVFMGGVSIGTTTADGSGNWTFDYSSTTLADGDYDITTVITDVAGNASGTSAPQTVSIDTSAPNAPEINVPTNNVSITGTGEPGATVTVTTGSSGGCTAIVQGDGSWSCDLSGPLTDGDDITASQEDPAGNTSPDTTENGGIDISPPGSGIITGISDDSGISNSDFITNDNTLLISGTAEADATVEVFMGGVSIGTTTADGSGNWTFDYSSTTLADGDYAITTVITDVAGNASGTSAPQTVSIDTSAPGAPVINVPTNGADVTGTGEPGATVDVETESGAICTATVQSDGTWSCTLTGTLTHGDDITATQSDVAGNKSDPTVETDGLDTEAPDAPSIDSPVDGSIINDVTPTISGTAEANSTVTISDLNGNVICETETNSNGNWSCEPDDPLTDGLYQLQAVAKDAAGNESQPGSTSFTVNSSATHTLIIDGATDLTTTEAGGSDSFTIVLPLTPTADVTVNLSSSDTTEGTVSPSSVTFTTANWNQPVSITVTGVDDQVYDQDQSYSIDFSPLSSTDNNYNGVQVSSVDVINEDDDAQPDLSVFITNCIDGSLPQQPISYYLTVTNEGNTDIQGARLTTALPGNITNPQWDCVDQTGQPCGRATGQGDLDELIDLNSQESMLFTFVADVDGNLHDLLNAYSQIYMPSGETDVNLLNNQAVDHDLLYQFLFKDGFECAAPGTVEVTNQQLEQLFNLR